MTISALLMLAGCVETQSRVDLSPALTTERILAEADVALVEQGVRSVLKDPDSAQFGYIDARTDADGVTYVCGHVNAKNSFGGYTGKKPFYGILAEFEFAPIIVGGDDVQISTARMLCGKYGIQI